MWWEAFCAVYRGAGGGARRKIFAAAAGLDQWPACERRGAFAGASPGWDWLRGGGKLRLLEEFYRATRVFWSRRSVGRATR
jgi:hypothetical protein